MKTRLMISLLFSLTFTGIRQSGAQLNGILPTSDSPVLKTEHTQQPDTQMAWWREARFGMFIHWGLYAVPAGEWNGKTGYGEWIRTSAEIPLDRYDLFKHSFNPVQFEAETWVRLARDAGMKYIVITAKHHDGFCMFGTKQTDFNILTTPFKHDPMLELAAACKKFGLKFCFYYSIMDWHHPDYLPRRDWEKNRTTEGADFNRYFSYMKAQLNELLSNYGDIGVLWFDGEWESAWNEKYGREIYDYVRALQPLILVNNRVGAGRIGNEGPPIGRAFGGDFGTPEQQIPDTGIPGVDWETCMTMNNHWGYNKTDKNYKPAREIIRMLADIASKGGNYLLNVGPTAHGLIPEESIERLETIGSWMKINGQAIYGTMASPFRDLAWGRCTQKKTTNGTILFLHVFNWPYDGKLEIPGILNTPEKAHFLSDHDTTRLKIMRTHENLVIVLPKTDPDSLLSVIALYLREKPDLTDPPEIINEFDTFTDSLSIILYSGRDSVEIRYNFGDSEPVFSSPLYTGPITVTTSATMNARCFRNGNPVSSAISKEFKKISPVPSINHHYDTTMEKGLLFRYYEGSWDSLPDFSQDKPIKTGTIRDFLFIPRNQDENFGFVYEGYVWIPETNVYSFSTISDDGSCLWIENQLVVNNDGLHGMVEKSGNIALAKGYHKIRLAYFERTGSDNLTVTIKSPTLSKQPLPQEILCH